MKDTIKSLLKHVPKEELEDALVGMICRAVSPIPFTVLEMLGGTEELKVSKETVKDTWRKDVRELKPSIALQRQGKQQAYIPGGPMYFKVPSGESSTGSAYSALCGKLYPDTPEGKLSVCAHVGRCKACRKAAGLDPVMVGKRRKKESGLRRRKCPYCGEMKVRSIQSLGQHKRHCKMRPAVIQRGKKDGGKA